MNTQAIIAFLVYAIINAFTPGPGNILAFNTMSNYGWKNGKKTLLGIFAGYYCVQALCAVFTFGLNQLLNPLIFVLKYVGAVYIAVLAIHIFRSRPEESSNGEGVSPLVGFILQFVNVKIYLFGITALTGYVLPYHSSFGMLIFFSMLISTIGSIATTLWAVFGAIFQRAYIRYFKVINIILALILLECAYGMLFK
ncbi:cysteine/O-acetylserine efflux protein [Clostridium homopropionicum DSM 5847]|uniref:Cysteine/O-acetylserine efflux protein n=1 Tax=Clostridium homopropionicum DSM 5847 TaxID=1121318 RepID=A0A0L6Z6A8_9CLOT|nr:LysE family transporter [Clostridium homopropionicum]KOA18495.1 cysteine/O-acetylserine efflux protein [Clostridium homopropionicum DSM 5847]SFF65858.1 cysteine/O-acetylserine efflux protein [Clostridium homopropionicum]